LSAQSRESLLGLGPFSSSAMLFVIIRPHNEEAVMGSASLGAIETRGMGGP
jgi:hypothetical protein